MLEPLVKSGGIFFPQYTKYTNFIKTLLCVPNIYNRGQTKTTPMNDIGIPALTTRGPAQAMTAKLYGWSFV